MATRREVQQIPNLCPCTIAILLHGWTEDRPPVACADDSHAGFFDLYEPGGMERLWTQHEFYLRAVAQQWDWKPECISADGRARFFGED